MVYHKISMKIGILTCFLFLIVSCEQIFQSRYVPPVTPPATPVTSLPPPPTTTSNIHTQSKWGVLKCHTVNQEEMNQFNINLKHFLSTKIDPKTINSGFSCTATLKGGVFIRGQVDLPREESYDPTSRNQQIYLNNDSNKSYLEFHFESYHGPNIQPFRMNFDYGSINGQVIVLTFQDQKGLVTLDGSVSNGIFKGTLSFENYITFSGQRPGVKGPLSAFAIPVCQLIECATTNGIGNNN